MADMICIALSAKNLHNPDYSNLGQGWFFALSSEKLQWKSTRKGKYFINNIIYKKGRSDDLADTAKVVSRKMLLLEI